MPDFNPLKLSKIERDTTDTVAVSLVPQEHELEKLKYLRGQYLTLKREFEGEEFRRSYSICSSAKDHNLRVGNKHVERGWCSSWANEEMQEGETEMLSNNALEDYEAELGLVFGCPFLPFADHITASFDEH